MILLVVVAFLLAVLGCGMLVVAWAIERPENVPRPGVPDGTPGGGPAPGPGHLILAAHRAPGWWQRLRWWVEDMLGWVRPYPAGDERTGHDADMAARPQQTALTEDVPRPGHAAQGDPARRFSSFVRHETAGLGHPPWSRAQAAGKPGSESSAAHGPGRLLIKAVPVQGHWLPLTPGEPKRFTANWQPVTGAVVPVRDRPALLRPWIAEALGAPSVDQAMAQIFGPRALALAGTP